MGVCYRGGGVCSGRGGIVVLVLLTGVMWGVVLGRGGDVHSGV